MLGLFGSICALIIIFFFSCILDLMSWIEDCIANKLSNWYYGIEAKKIEEKEKREAEYMKRESERLKSERGV